MSFIKKLQNKPRFIRIQILWISVILIMLIIFSFWMVFLKASLSAPTSEKESQKSSQSMPSLFNTIKNDIGLLKNNLKAGIEKITELGEEKEIKTEIIAPKPAKLPGE